jgi:hypothetical protein
LADANAQNRATYLNQQRAKREALYTEFIDEASRLFTDALSHEMEDLSKMVHLYSITNKIRLFASPDSSPALLYRGMRLPRSGDAAAGQRFHSADPNRW